MSVALQDILNLYVFSTGRRLFSLKQVHQAAKERKLSALASQVAEAIKHDRATRTLERRWSKQSSVSPGAGEAPRIDALIDRTVSGLRDAAQAHAEGAEPGEAIIKVVNDFVEDLFPAGVPAVTQLAYVDELSAVEEVLEKLKGPHAKTVKELGLERFVARLEALLPKDRAALEGPKSELSFGAVKAARAQGQDFLLQTVAMIVGAFPKSTSDHVAARTALLTPILRQNEAIRQYMRGRRGGSIADVDPETGEPEVIEAGSEGNGAEEAPGMGQGKGGKDG